MLVLNGTPALGLGLVLVKTWSWLAINSGRAGSVLKTFNYSPVWEI